MAGAKSANHLKPPDSGYGSSNTSAAGSVASSNGGSASPMSSKAISYFGEGQGPKSDPRLLQRPTSTVNSQHTVPPVDAQQQVQPVSTQHKVQPVDSQDVAQPVDPKLAALFTNPQPVTTTLGQFHEVPTNNKLFLYKIDWDNAEHLIKTDKGEFPDVVKLRADSKYAHTIFKAFMKSLEADGYLAIGADDNSVFTVTGTRFKAIAAISIPPLRMAVEWRDDDGRERKSMLPFQAIQAKQSGPIQADLRTHKATGYIHSEGGPLNSHFAFKPAITLRSGSTHPSVQVKTSLAIIPHREGNRLPEFLQELHVNTVINDSKQRDDWIRTLSRLFRGVKVDRLYALKREKKKHPRASIIAFGLPANQQTFKIDDGNADKQECITVQEYFKQQHKLSLANSEFPAVNIGQSKRPIWVPMELLWVVHDQTLSKKLIDYIGKLDSTDTADEWRKWTDAARLPNAKLVDDTAIAASHMSELMGANVVRTPVQLLSKEIPPHVIPDRIDLKKGRWILKGKELVKYGDLEPKTLLFFIGGDLKLTEKNTPEAGKLFNKLFGAFKQFGFKNLTFDFSRIQSEGPSGVLHIPTIMAAIVEKYSKKKQNAPIFIITNSLDKTYHTELRRQLDFAGIRAVMINLYDKGNGNTNYLITDEKFEIHLAHQELALKLNAMSDDGRNFEIHPNINHDGKHNAMLIGATVTRPGSAASVGCPAIASMIASTDPTFSQFPGTMRLQAADKPEIEAMYSMMRECMLRYHKNHGNLPSKLLLYRGGIAEPEYRAIKDLEVMSIHRAYDELAMELKIPKKHLEVVILVVEKNHKARFAPQDGSKDRLDYGTFVDIPQLDDGCRQFFLQAFSNLHIGQPKPKDGVEQARVAPARNTHYYLVHNESQYVIEIVKSLTYTSCWLAPHSSSVLTCAAPIVLAEKLAARGRAYLHKVWCGQAKIHKIPQTLWKLSSGRDVPWHSSLDDAMFYL